MSKKSNVLSSTTLLSVAVGLFLLLSGIQAVIGLNSSAAQFTQGLGKLFGASPVPVVVAWVIAVLEIASGAILIVGPFGLIAGGVHSLAFWIIIGFWTAQTIWASFFGSAVFKPTPMAWFTTLSLNVAILASLWQVKPDKS